MGLPDGEKTLMICLLVLTQLTNMTDTHMDTAWWHRPHLCIASHGKNSKNGSKHSLKCSSLKDGSFLKQRIISEDENSCWLCSAMLTSAAATRNVHCCVMFDKLISSQMLQHNSSIILHILYIYTQLIHNSTKYASICTVSVGSCITAFSTDIGCITPVIKMIVNY